MIYVTFSKRQNYSDTEQSSDCQGLEIGKVCDYKEVAREFFEDARTICYLNCGRAYINLYMLKFT